MSGLAAALARRRRPLRRALPAMSARLRRRLLALLLLTLALAGGYWFWLRDSSLVAVDEVSVTGLSTEDSERVRLALMATAKRMTTLHVDRERLEQAVAPYPVVRALEVTTDFPHGMRIRVIEHEPAAMAVSDGARLPVAGDGTILRGMPVEGHLPLVEVEGALAGDRLREATARAAATIAGAAPALLRRRVEQIEKRPELGLVAELREGPELIFGDGVRARAQVGGRGPRAGRSRGARSQLHRPAHPEPACRRGAARGDRGARGPGRADAARHDHRAARDRRDHGAGHGRRSRRAHRPGGRRAGEQHSGHAHRTSARPAHGRSGGRRGRADDTLINPRP